MLKQYRRYFVELHGLILSSHQSPGFPSRPFPSGPSTKTLYVTALSIRATCPAYLVPDFITEIVFGREYRSWTSSLCSLLHSPDTSSFL